MDVKHVAPVASSLRSPATIAPYFPSIDLQVTRREPRQTTGIINHRFTVWAESGATRVREPGQWQRANSQRRRTKPRVPNPLKRCVPCFVFFLGGPPDSRPVSGKIELGNTRRSPQQSSPGQRCRPPRSYSSRGGCPPISVTTPLRKMHRAGATDSH